MESNYDYKHEFTEEDIKSIIARYINEQYGRFNEPRVYADDVHLTMERNENGAWDMKATTNMHRTVPNEKV